MFSLNEEQAIVKKLYKVYQEKGYISEKIILDSIIEYGLPLDEVDYVCDKLLSMGIIICDDAGSDEHEECYDRSQIDYEELFKKVITIDESLKPFIDEVRTIKPPQHRECQNLISQAKNNNVFAKERIIKMYLRTVVKIAFSYHRKFKIPLAEAIQDGSLGLVIALNKFQIYKHDNFFKYASCWISQSIIRQAPALNYNVHFPVHVKNKLFKIYEILEKHFYEKYDKKDVCSEIVKIVSKKLKCSQEETKEYIEYLECFESVEELINKDEDVFCDMGKIEEKILDDYNKKEAKDMFSKMFNILTEREKRVLLLRFGFIEGRTCTLEQIGVEFNVTRERIRQIEAKALRKFLHPKRISKLKCFL